MLSTEHVRDGVRLLRIAHFCTRAVRFDIGDLRGIDARLTVDLFEQLCLSIARWKCDACVLN
jgi:hypothetical protein